jgi:hypothetical protein
MGWFERTSASEISSSRRTGGGTVQFDVALDAARRGHGTPLMVDA